MLREVSLIKLTGSHTKRRQESCRGGGMWLVGEGGDDREE